MAFSERPLLDKIHQFNRSVELMASLNAVKTKLDCCHLETDVFKFHYGHNSYTLWIQTFHKANVCECIM